MSTTLFDGNKKKAVTFSFDDGTFYDVMLVELFRKYNLKGTFNINTGLFGQTANLDFKSQIIFHNRISEEQTKILYKGHELAAHSLTHPLLTNRTKEFLDGEVLTDCNNLERITGCKTEGFVVPGGPVDANLINYLEDKFLYVRTVKSTRSYDIPKSFVPFDPTIFILDDDFEKVCSSYIDYKSDELSWLYIWGHSYEFALPGVLERFESVVKKLASCDDIWFCTNKDVIKCIKNVNSKNEEDLE